MNINRYKTRKDLMIEVLNRNINIRLHLDDVYTIDENYQWTNEYAVHLIIDNDSDLDYGSDCGSDCDSDCEYKCNQNCYSDGYQVSGSDCTYTYATNNTLNDIDVLNKDIAIEINIDLHDLKEDITSDHINLDGTILNSTVQYKKDFI